MPPPATSYPPSAGLIDIIMLGQTISKQYLGFTNPLVETYVGFANPLVEESSHLVEEDESSA